MRWMRAGVLHVCKPAGRGVRPRGFDRRVRGRFSSISSTSKAPLYGIILQSVEEARRRRERRT